MTPVAIVGGGIGGLTAGRALRQRGIEVAIYEAAPGLRRDRRRGRPAPERHEGAPTAWPRGRRPSHRRALGVGAHAQLEDRAGDLEDQPAPAGEHVRQCGRHRASPTCWPPRSPPGRMIRLRGWPSTSARVVRVRAPSSWPRAGAASATTWPSRGPPCDGTCRSPCAGASAETPTVAAPRGSPNTTPAPPRRSPPDRGGARAGRGSGGQGVRGSGGQDESAPTRSAVPSWASRAVTFSVSRWTRISRISAPLITMYSIPSFS